MAVKSKRNESLNVESAMVLLEEHWKAVTTKAVVNPHFDYVQDKAVRDSIRDSINHRRVSYRFCLPIQLLGKIANPALDCLRLQKSNPDDTTGWDARSFGKKVVATFNKHQENILGTSEDPYVGNPMRIPKMFRDDQSKKDMHGWNSLVELLSQVEQQANPLFTEALFHQTLLEMFRRQQSLKFSYPIPPRVSLDLTLDISTKFLQERSGGERAQALAGGLFDAIGLHFGIFAKVNRAAINASDEATGQAADLECLDNTGKLVLVVEVKDRNVTLDDVEGTLLKSRPRQITEILFAGKGIRANEKTVIDDRISRAFTAGQNLYIFDFFDLARSILAIGGEAIRITFLRKVGEHLDTWNTQPAHRQAWQKLLQEL